MKILLAVFRIIIIGYLLFVLGVWWLLSVAHNIQPDLDKEAGLQVIICIVLISVITYFMRTKYAAKPYFKNTALDEPINPDFIATLTYLTTEEGGRKTPAYSGYRPIIQFPFDSYRTSGKQVFLGKAEVMPGETIDAEITIVSKEYFASKLSEGMTFQFRESKPLIGTGVIKQILNESLKSNLNVRD